METFTIRDLREHTGSLIRDAEQGKLSLVTKRGRPVFLAVPFTEDLLQIGLPVALAIELYQENIMSLEKAAKVAGYSIESFIDILGKFKIPVVNYSSVELDKELKDFE